MKRCVVFVVALALFAGCKGSAKSDAELIQGDWEATSGEEDGKAVPPEKLKERKVTVTATAIVFNHHGPEQGFHLICQRASHGVVRATRREGNHQPDGVRRIGLRPRDAGDGRQRGSANGQMQKFATGKCPHVSAPWVAAQRGQVCRST